VPTTPGDYLIRYYLDQDRVAIAEVPISVTEVGASITAPATAIAGSGIEVGWTGPDNRNDYIGIGAVGATGNARWENFAYTEAGNPATLLVPTTPGDYLIRYYLDQDRVAIAEVPISVQPVTASITAPASAVAGSTVDIDWTGPDYRNDYIGIGAPGATGNARWENFTYTSDGTPLALLMPATPGPYLIRYYMDQDRVTIGETSIIVTPAMATLSVKETSVEAGSMIEVDWTGPDYRNDYIGMGPVGASRNGQWEAFAYTEGGTPAMLQAPDTPGDYVIQYFMDQDRTSIATLPITVR
jgi:Ca-activated chloride channel family protein